jgi:hypothetical protein
MSKSRLAVIKLIPLLWAAGSIGQEVTASATDVWVSGPSVISRSEPIVFRGGNFQPGMTLHITVTDPQGQHYDEYVIADDRGGFSQAIVPGATGAYELTVTTAEGALLHKNHFAISD